MYMKCCVRNVKKWNYKFSSYHEEEEEEVVVVVVVIWNIMNFLLPAAMQQ